MVPVQRQAAVRAIVPTVGERLAHFAAAPIAFLACAFGINFHEANSAAFGLASQRQQKAGPSGICYRPAQPAVPEHPPDVQAFGRDEAVTTDQTKGNPMMMLAAQVADAGVNPLQTANGLVAVLAALFLAADSTAGNPQLGQRVLEVSRVRFPDAVRRGKERFQSHVDADSRLAVVRNGNVPQLTREGDVPLARLALERHGLDRAFHRAMQLDANRADMLDVQARPMQTDAVAVGGKLDAVETVLSLEAWVAGFAPGSATAEERLKGAVQTAHRRLCRREVQPREEGVNGTLVLEPRGLLRVLNRSPLGFVCRFALFETSIVQTPVRLKGDAKLTLLIGVRPQPVAKGASHNNILRGSDSFF